MAKGEGAEVRGEVLFAGDGGGSDEDGDDADIALEGVGDFEADEVFRLVEAADAVMAGGEPTLADDGEEDVAAGDAVLDDGDEVVAAADGVEVHEDVVAAEVGDEDVVETSGVSAAVFPAITDEDSGQWGPPRLEWCGGIIVP